MIGISRQHLEFAVQGKRNLSFANAKKAAALFRSPLSIWQDPEQVKKRQTVWEQFKKLQRAREGKQ